MILPLDTAAIHAAAADDCALVSQLVFHLDGRVGQGALARAARTPRMATIVGPITPTLWKIQAIEHAIRNGTLAVVAPLARGVSSIRLERALDEARKMRSQEVVSHLLSMGVDSPPCFSTRRPMFETRAPKRSRVV